jgi:hypothetical protein
MFAHRGDTRYTNEEHVLDTQVYGAGALVVSAGRDVVVKGSDVGRRGTASKN